MVIERHAAHTALMEVINQETLIEIVAVVLAPMALITAAVVAVAFLTGVAGRLVMAVEDLTNLPIARRQVAHRVATPLGSPRTGGRA